MRKHVHDHREWVAKKQSQGIVKRFDIKANAICKSLDILANYRRHWKAKFGLEIFTWMISNRTYQERQWDRSEAEVHRSLESLRQAP